MQQLDMYTETLIRQQSAEVQAKIERRQLVREALAGRRATFYKPLLVSVGKRMVAWGTQLQRRYDDLTPNAASDVTLAMQNK